MSRPSFLGVSAWIFKGFRPPRLAIPAGCIPAAFPALRDSPSSLQLLTSDLQITRLSTDPRTAATASPMASQTVGCACTMNIMSSTVASSCSAVTGSATISVASGPMMCTPSKFRASSSATTLMKPSWWSRMVALLLPDERKFPDLHVVARLARLPLGQPDGRRSAARSRWRWECACARAAARVCR